MAKFRMVYTAFWDDPKVIEELTPEDKYFFLYLLTNSKTTQIGIYQITKRQMSFDLGYAMESVQALLDRFVNCYQLIQYNPDTREIAIRNWGKYNLNRGGKPMMDCIESELVEVKDHGLIRYVAEQIWHKDIRKCFNVFVTKHTMLDKQSNSSPNAFYDSDTIRGQEEQEEEQEEKDIKEQQEQQQDNIPLVATESSKQNSVAKVIQFWDNNGFGINNLYGKEQLLAYLEKSNFREPHKVIIKALQIACENDIRRLKYVEGILNNWENESLLSIEEIEASKQNRKKESTYDPLVERF